MQIERAIVGVNTLGPGNRLAIWVNGCNRRCPGCVSERLQRKAPENECDVYDYFLQYDIAAIDGLTISGGEPFEQIEGLYQIVKLFISKGIIDILIYTGYTIEELRERHDFRIEYILSNIAVLIDGPYIQSLDIQEGNLCGSTNQRIIILNSKMEEKYTSYQCTERRMQEFFFGRIKVAVGIPNKAYINSFKNN